VEAYGVVSLGVLYPFYLYLHTVAAFFEFVLHLLETDPVRAHLGIFLLIFPWTSINTIDPLEKGENSYNFFILGSVGIHSGVIVVDFCISCSHLISRDAE
jgi:hypothetical protein